MSNSDNSNINKEKLAVLKYKSPTKLILDYVQIKKYFKKEKKKFNDIFLTTDNGSRVLKDVFDFLEDEAVTFKSRKQGFKGLCILLNVKNADDLDTVIEVTDKDGFEVSKLDVINAVLEEFGLGTTNTKSFMKPSSYRENESYDLASLKKLYNYLKKNTSLKKLSGHYEYCQDLSGAFQEFDVSIEAKIDNIQKVIDIINESKGFHQFQNNKEEEDLFKKKCQSNGLFYNECNDLCGENREKAISAISKRIINKTRENLNLWIDAYSIQKAYKKCKINKDILFYSHRISGWSSPVCLLKKDLSAEYKSNFGYGRSSYFYLKLIFRDIELVAHDNIIKYRYADFKEVIKYTERYVVSNKSWIPAMRYLIEAYDLLVKDEEKFIRKHLSSVLRNLGKGIQELIYEKKYSFEDGEILISDKSFYDAVTMREEEQISVNGNFRAYINGNVRNIAFLENRKEDLKVTHTELVMFRAKKATDSLRLVDKIREYAHIVEVNETIRVIKDVNKSIISELKFEIKDLKSQIKKFFRKTNYERLAATPIEELSDDEETEYLQLDEMFNQLSDAKKTLANFKHYIELKTKSDQ